MHSATNGADTNVPADEIDIGEALRQAVKGTELHRVKMGSVGSSRLVQLSADHSRLSYTGKTTCLPNHLKTVDTTEILEIRKGWHTDNFNKATQKQKFVKNQKENCSFSVILRHPHLFQKAVDFIAPTPEIANLWAAVINHLVSSRKKEVAHFNEDVWLQKKFEEADTDKSGTMSFDEMWVLLNKLNIEVTQQYAKKIFASPDIKNSAKKKGEKALDKLEFTNFFRKLTERPELRKIMSEYSSIKDSFFLPADLKAFMKDEYGVELSDDQCNKIIEEFDPEQKESRVQVLTENGFRKLLMSDYCSLLNKDLVARRHDMTLPLPSYFINSSHNTYLLGGQLAGTASVEGYVHALKKGARLVEIDVWDGEGGEPIVTHGMTLVQPILLKDVVRAINAYAFEASPYPVILSIENHASFEYQKTMANHFREIFGDKLYLREFTSDDATFPSPEELKYKILVKNKKLGKSLSKKSLMSKRESLKSSQMSKSLDSNDIQYRMSYDENPPLDGENRPNSVVIISVGHQESVELELDDEDDEDLEENNNQIPQKGKGKEKPKKPEPICQELSDVTTVRSVHLKDLQKGLREHPCDSCASWVESKVLKNIVENYSQLLQYTSKHLVKGYPSGLRTESSNMMPMPQWLAGIQIVALNFQTPGEEMDLNEAFFVQNGGSGYYLKPTELRNATLNLKELAERPVKKIMTVTVISGQYLPKPSSDKNALINDIVDPFVTVQIYGLDCDQKTEKTETIDNNGFNPVWNSEFIFRLRAPQLALIRFCVLDEDVGSTDFVGQFTAPVECLNEGYFQLELLTDRGTKSSGYLLVKIKTTNVGSGATNDRF